MSSVPPCIPYSEDPVLLSALLISVSLVYFLVSGIAASCWNGHARRDFVPWAFVVLLVCAVIALKGFFRWNANRFTECCTQHIFVADSLGSMPSVHAALATFLVLFTFGPLAYVVRFHSKRILPLDGTLPPLLPPLPPYDEMSKVEASVRIFFIVLYALLVCASRVLLGLASIGDLMAGSMVGIVFFSGFKWVEEQMQQARLENSDNCVIKGE